MRVIIGAGKTAYPGWISTNEEELNLLREGSFAAFFGNDRAEAFLLEHVLEHLTMEEAERAAKLMRRYLKVGGYIRIAVPDANFRSEWYQMTCRPGGPGPADHPAYTHKVFYDLDHLSGVLSRAGLRVDPLEYCDKNGRFTFRYWDPEGGMIGRSLRFDTRNRDGKLGMVSLIFDAYRDAE